jgi:hypothetical protein
MLPLQTLNPLQIVKYYRSISFHHLTEIWRSPQCLTCDTPHATIEKMYPDKDTFLVEIRLARTKWRIKSHIRTIADMFRLNDCMEIHPHITLYGPLTLCNDSTVEDLMTAIDRVVSVYSGPIPFTIAGYERRDGLHGGVIAFGVRPSGALCTLTRSLSREISGIATRRINGSM